MQDAMESVMDSEDLEEETEEQVRTPPAKRLSCPAAHGARSTLHSNLPCCALLAAHCWLGAHCMPHLLGGWQDWVRLPRMQVRWPLVLHCHRMAPPHQRFAMPPSRRWLQVDKILLEVAGETLSQMAAAPRQQKQVRWLCGSKPPGQPLVQDTGALLAHALERGSPQA